MLVSITTHIMFLYNSKPLEEKILVCLLFGQSYWSFVVTTGMLAASLFISGSRTVLDMQNISTCIAKPFKLLCMFYMGILHFVREQIFLKIKDTLKFYKAIRSPNYLKFSFVKTLWRCVYAVYSQVRMAT